MFESDREEREWLDEELRRVPTPEGLLRRIKAIGAVEDAQIDAVVREAVTVPGGLLAQLKAIPQDEAIDRHLREVDVPDSLVESLRMIADKSESVTSSAFSGRDTLLDMAPRTVSIASQFQTSDRASGVRNSTNWSRQILDHPLISASVAACLLIAVGLSAWFGLASWNPFGGPAESTVADSQPADPESVASLNAQSIAKSNRRENQSPTVPEQETNPHSPVIVLDEGSTDVPMAERMLVDSNSNDRGGAPGTVSRPDGGNSLAEETQSPSVIASDQPDGALDFTPFGAPEERIARRQSLNNPPFAPEEVRPPLERIIGFGGTQHVPAIETVRGLIPRGVGPPFVKDFDQVRLLHDGVHPFVSPTAHRDLAQIHVPLSLDTHSYQLLKEYLANGRLPSPDDIRPEDFLAAIDFEYPQPGFAQAGQGELALGKIGLTAAAGPSSFGDNEMQLLQIGVQTSDEIPRKLPPAELVIAVDVTPGIAGKRRLAILRQALTQFHDWFARGDRVTLIPLTADATALSDRAGREDRAAWTDAVSELATRASADLPAGLGVADRLATRADSYAWRRNVVLVLGSLDEYTPAELDTFESVIKRSVGKRVRWDVIGIDAAPPALSNKDAGAGIRTHSPHERLARAGQGSLHETLDGPEVLSALTEILTGSSSLVAKKTRLTVHFEPSTVARYRLIGHEALQTTLQKPGKLEIELRTGQAATALFELELQLNGGDNVAQAELTWVDAETGEEKRLVQRISRLQFATTTFESPLSLQMAAMVAEAAEILRGSPFANSHRQALADVLSEAQSVSPRVRSNRSFTEFLAVIQQANQRRVGSR